jgi:hypothetical protein
METISIGTTIVERSSALALSAAGFDKSGRVATPQNDLCGALLAIARHDLRQPMQVLIGAHNILAKSLDGRPEQAQLARAESAISKLSDKLDQLVDALRRFSPTPRNSANPRASKGSGFARFRRMPPCRATRYYCAASCETLSGTRSTIRQAAAASLSARVSGARRSVLRCATAASESAPRT